MVFHVSICESAWNIDPFAGVIGVQYCPLPFCLMLQFLRIGVPALRQKWRTTIVPSHQLALRTNLGDRHHEPVLQGTAVDLHRSENDNRPARPLDPPLRYPETRKPKLALQEPLINQSHRLGWPVAPVGQYWTPIGSQGSKPIDTRGSLAVVDRVTSKPKSAAISMFKFDPRLSRPSGGTSNLAKSACRITV